MLTYKLLQGRLTYAIECLGVPSSVVLPKIWSVVLICIIPNVLSCKFATLMLGLIGILELGSHCVKRVFQSFLNRIILTGPVIALIIIVPFLFSIFVRF